MKKISLLLISLFCVNVSIMRADNESEFYQQTSGWEWLFTDDYTKKEVAYPVKTSYLVYKNHPQYCVNNKGVYNENGQLVRVSDMMEKTYINKWGEQKHEIINVVRNDYLKYITNILNTFNLVAEAKIMNVEIPRNAKWISESNLRRNQYGMVSTSDMNNLNYTINNFYDNPLQEEIYLNYVLCDTRKDEPIKLSKKKVDDLRVAVKKANDYNIGKNKGKSYNVAARINSALNTIGDEEVPRYDSLIVMDLIEDNENIILKVCYDPIKWNRQRNDFHQSVVKNTYKYFTSRDNFSNFRQEKGILLSTLMIYDYKHNKYNIKDTQSAEILKMIETKLGLQQQSTDLKNDKESKEIAKIICNSLGVKYYDGIKVDNISAQLRKMHPSWSEQYIENQIANTMYEALLVVSMSKSAADSEKYKDANNYIKQLEMDHQEDCNITNIERIDDVTFRIHFNSEEKYGYVVLVRYYSDAPFTYKSKITAEKL